MRTEDNVRQEIKNRTLTHMLRTIRTTPAETNPFPHFIAQGIFPGDVYQEILKLLPDSALYEAFDYDKFMTAGKSNRGRFKLTSASIERLSARQRSLWLAVRDALGAPEFKASVFDRLQPGLTFRFGVKEARKLAAYPLPELFRETSGYRIKPHPDTRRKVVTMQIALPADDRQKDLGTEFYRRSLNPLHLLREPRGFEVVKTTPFLPNTCYAFSVINSLKLKSWHGRTLLIGEVGTRNTILNIWYADPADANQDLVEQYYQRAAAKAA
ncbi:MAG TPA: hypothetical protein VFE46_05705 [Pirellulales bacterium]|jgi:hypothetical protein|nr:hypothetical protein [Pirellulales bacterium]